MSATIRCGALTEYGQHLFWCYMLRYIQRAMCNIQLELHDHGAKAMHMYTFCFDVQRCLALCQYLPLLSKRLVNNSHNTPRCKNNARVISIWSTIFNCTGEWHIMCIIQLGFPDQGVSDICQACDSVKYFISDHSHHLCSIGLDLIFSIVQKVLYLF